MNLNFALDNKCLDINSDEKRNPVLTSTFSTKNMFFWKEMLKTYYVAMTSSELRRRLCNHHSIFISLWNFSMKLNQWNSSKAFVIKSVTMGEGGVKNNPNWKRMEFCLHKVLGNNNLSNKIDANLKRMTDIFALFTAFKKLFVRMKS